MVNKHSVEGYEAFNEFINNFDSQGQLVHVYFGGSKDPNGVSWCDDCIRAWPVIENELEKLDPKSHFIIVEVGDRLTCKAIDLVKNKISLKIDNFDIYECTLYLEKYPGEQEKAIASYVKLHAFKNTIQLLWGRSSITWKDPNCPFRKDPKTKLMVLPTLLRWLCPQKLEGEQCEKPELVSMLFTLEDDD